MKKLFLLLGLTMFATSGAIAQVGAGGGGAAAGEAGSTSAATAGAGSTSGR